MSTISFNAGELTELVDARSDISKYASGCRTCENMIPLDYGCAERRPGFEYINGQISNSVVGIVVPFIYSNTIAYVIEMGALKFKFYFDGGIVLDDDSNEVATTTPYIEADLFQIQFAQSNDVMWLTHNSYAPRKLKRVTASEFTLEEIEFKFGPFLDRNDYVNDDNVTLTSSVIAKDDVGTLTAAAPFSPLSTFQSGHVGSLWKLTLPRSDTYTSDSATGTGVLGEVINIDGPFTFKTAGHWGATIELQRNEDSNGWETYRTWRSVLSAGVGSLNAQFTGIEYAQNVQYRMNVTVYNGGTVEASITANTSTQSGIVKIQSVESVSSATVKVISNLSSTGITKQWYEGAWSGVRGYPKAVTFFQDRTVYAGTTFQPQTVWLSESGLFDKIT